MPKLVAISRSNSPLMSLSRVVTLPSLSHSSLGPFQVTSKYALTTMLAVVAWKLRV